MKRILLPIFLLVFLFGCNGEKEKEKVLTPFENQVQTWLIASDLNNSENRGAALRLAQSFKIVARTIESGVYETTDGVILATAWANTDALAKDLEAWKPFLRHFQNYLEANPPSSIKSHVSVWDDMANTLEKIFGAPC